MQILNISVQNRPAKQVTSKVYSVECLPKFKAHATGERAVLIYRGVYPQGYYKLNAIGARIVLRPSSVKYVVDPQNFNTTAIGGRIIKKSLLTRYTVPPESFTTTARGNKVVVRKLLLKYRVESQSFNVTATGGSLKLGV